MRGASQDGSLCQYELKDGFSRKIGFNSTLAFFVSGPKRTLNGSRTDPERIPNGSRTDPQRIPNGPRTPLEQIPNGPRTDPARIPNGPRTNPARTPGGANLLRDSITSKHLKTLENNPKTLQNLRKCSKHPKRQKRHRFFAAAVAAAKNR